MDMFNVFEQSSSNRPDQENGKQENRLAVLLGKKREAGKPEETKTKKKRPSERKEEERAMEEDIKQEDFIEPMNSVEETKFKIDQARCDFLSTSSVESPHIKIHVVEALELCLHEVAIPPGIPYKPLIRPKTLLKEYKFLLDPFQKEAIMCIENDESVLVSAHTSSGKTVVGEYSILKSLKLKQRVIYTTPIKALSNQKYREFQEEFQDVGLITGDVTINPSAGCLIMTTEILRNMLYRGSVIIKEVSWVIFDEIHYMRDKERGVVWEETLILLPDNVHYVFLSATIPNARQFAEWVAHIHNQPCHVVYTDYRPTPLQHYIFPVGGDCLHLVVDEKGVFNERNFELAMKLISNPGLVQKTENKVKKGRSNEGKETSCLKIVRMVMEKNLAPAIIFSFSKKDCEVYAMQIAKLDFNTSEEKRLVDEIFQNAMDILSEEDRALPQVENVLPLLRRGIGIHHGGLLPILKETIEVLFSEGLIKALFATETFAMGLNMPARTVVFTATKKFDGHESRSITSGEYIQMSGRAGRRGLDDKGTVIVMMEEMFGPLVGKSLFQGKADALNSAFHLSYNMILNLIRVDDINPEYLLDRSFFQFQNHANIPVLKTELKQVEEKLANIEIKHETDVSSYDRLVKEREQLYKEYVAYIHNPDVIQQFLRPGRLVRIKEMKKEEDFGWAMLLSFKVINSKKKNPAQEPATLTIDVLLMIDPSSSNTDPKKCPKGVTGKLCVITMPHTNIMELSSVCVVLPKDLRTQDNMATASMAYKEVEERFKGKFPILDPVKNMRIQQERFLELDQHIKNLTKRIENHKANQYSDLDKLLSVLDEKNKLLQNKNNIKTEMEKCLSLLHMEELKSRKRVLRRLEFCTETDVIELKGRVACEISSADELLLTEMLFAGIFNDLSPQNATALLSCFVCEEKGTNNSKVPDELIAPLRHTKELAKRILNVCVEAKLDIDKSGYLEQVRPFLAEVVLAWCNGVSFMEVCRISDTFEGNIIRCLRRLEELLRQFIQAAKTLGNQDLEIKFNEGIRMIKRDIVFAASLYL
ncbi:exosome RNA helicase MTR4 [Cimex lectularius]|uniref:Superkiller viralicidic activity 2-like 2 n=1 Tax=Cimex lectularius TaxID=79782 RepID=A0A8I6RBQ7_CIMLE|nr:exosome RNA helicase MTR4 [Cimex lectularius]